MQRRVPRVLAPATAVTLLPLLVGCVESRPDEWRGSIDTLQNGVVLVHNPSTGAWDSASAWRLVEDLRIGAVEGTGPDVLGNVIALEVDAEGRIFVLESQAKEIRVFGRDGVFVRSFGREGAGPGEFKSGFGMAWDPEGRLWVADAGNARYAAFDTAGQYITQRRRPASFHRVPFPGGFDRAGGLYDTGLDASSGEETMIRLAPEPESIDTFPLPEDEGERFEIPQRVSVVVPFGASLVWRFDPRGYLWHGMNDSYRIVQQRMGGDTVRFIEREYTPIPVTAAERTEAIERLEWFTRQGGTIEPSRIPGEKPAFRNITVDDAGYLWVRLPTREGEQGSVFDVFDPEGRYLGSVRSDVTLPLYQPLLIRRDLLYAVVTDELDVPHVVRMKIEGRL